MYGNTDTINDTNLTYTQEEEKANMSLRRPYVSDLGLTTYDDEKGQQFLRDQKNVFINPLVQMHQQTLPVARRPYSPDYESEWCVTPRHSDSE